MALIEVLLPAMGEGIIEATLISWSRNEGEQVSAEENLIEVATDKVNSEVPSTSSGKLLKKLYADNDVIKVGAPFAVIGTSESDTIDSYVIAKAEVANSSVTPQKIGSKKSNSSSNSVQHSNLNLTQFANNGNRFFSPLVKTIAIQEGLTMDVLNSIPGSGAEGRLTKYDLENYLAQNKKTSTSSTTSPVKSASNEPEKPIDFGPNTEVQKIDRMRKLIGEHMVKSVQTSPHVCSFVEADMTNIVTWRNKMKPLFQEKFGVNITFTPIIIEAIVKALKDFPLINSSLIGENIVIKKNINLGMAAALPDGNLIVPVIKNAGEMDLVTLAKSVNDLGLRAKKNELKPDEIQGGTYTMTNLGSFGNLFGTPIINQPQVAILGIGAIVKKAVVIESKEGDEIGIKSMMYLSHSYDHRIVDGMLGGTFVKRVAEYLESFDMNREI